MKAHFLQRARARLETMRADAVKTVQAEVAASREPTGAEAADVHDTATDDRERELRLLLTDRDRGKLEAIEQALSRIDAGTYGICELCEEDIAEGRLEVLPFTSVCVLCQADRERQRAQHAAVTEGRSLTGALADFFDDGDAPSARGAAVG